MRMRLRVVAPFFALLLGLPLASAWAIKYDVPTAPPEYLALINPRTSPDDIAKGRKQYSSKCATCHGDEGEGDKDKPKVVAFRDRTWMVARPDGQLFYIAKMGAGKDSDMEAWGPESDNGLSEEKLWQIIAYIRTLASQN